jgi:hypothetical protein
MKVVDSHCPPIFELHLSLHQLSSSPLGGVETMAIAAVYSDAFWKTSLVIDRHDSDMERSYSQFKVRSEIVTDTQKNNFDVVSWISS